MDHAKVSATTGEFALKPSIKAFDFKNLNRQKTIYLKLYLICNQGETGEWKTSQYFILSASFIKTGHLEPIRRSVFRLRRRSNLSLVFRKQERRILTVIDSGKIVKRLLRWPELVNKRYLNPKGKENIPMK